MNQLSRVNYNDFTTMTVIKQHQMIKVKLNKVGRTQNQ